MPDSSGARARPPRSTSFEAKRSPRGHLDQVRRAAGPSSATGSSRSAAPGREYCRKSVIRAYSSGRSPGPRCSISALRLLALSATLTETSVLRSWIEPEMACQRVADLVGDLAESISPTAARPLGAAQVTLHRHHLRSRPERSRRDLSGLLSGHRRPSGSKPASPRKSFSPRAVLVLDPQPRRRRCPPTSPAVLLMAAEHQCRERRGSRPRTMEFPAPHAHVSPVIRSASGLKEVTRSPAEIGREQTAHQALSPCAGAASAAILEVAGALIERLAGPFELRGEPLDRTAHQGRGRPT